MTTNHVPWLLLCLAALAAAEDLFKPGVNDKCADFCKQTYSSQADVDACEEGCRVFSMLQFVSGNDKIDSIREKCQAGCVKSFANFDVQESCKAGCGRQVPFTGGSMEISMNSDDPMFKVAKSAFDGVFDRMSQQMNENFEQFGSVFGERDPFKNMQRDMDQMSQRMENLMNRLMGRQPTSPRVESGDEASASGKPIRVGGHQNLAFEGPQVDNLNDKNEPILHVEMSPIDANRFNWFDTQPRQVVYGDINSDDANWLACLAARARRLSMMTRWLVCLALFMCIICMLWICMAIMRTAPRRRLLIQRSDAVMKIATIDSSAVEKQLLAQQEAKSSFIPPVHNTPPPAYDELTAPEEKRPLA